MRSGLAPFQYSTSTLAQVYGTYPWTVVLPDLNGDGRTDIVVGSRGNVQNGDDGGIFSALGFGNGNFGTPVQTAKSVLAQEIVAADFQGDGRPDLASIRVQEQEVAILENTGNGELGAAQVLDGPQDSERLAIADLNGDALEDLVLVHGDPGTVSVWLALAEGLFASPVEFDSGGDQPESIVIADLDSDGAFDLVVANRSGGEIAVLLGDGAGSFAPAIVSPSGPNLVDLALGDLDSDGFCDVVGIAQFPDLAYVLLGNGDGSATLAGTLPLGSVPASGTIADVDADGILDLVVAQSGSGDVALLRGGGDGSFSPLTTYDAGGPPRTIEYADVTEDGLEDLVVGVSEIAAGRVAVFPGLAAGLFGPPQFVAEGSTPFSIDVADVNVDGKLDLVLGNLFQSSVWVVLGAGGGAFEAPSRFSGALGTDDVAAIDVDRDTLPDLVITDRFVGGALILRSLLLD